jgi:hypothetical protein
MAEGVRLARGHLRHRRHDLPQAGQALRRRPAAVLRRPGQEGQLPVRRQRPLRGPGRPLPLEYAALPARRLARRRGPPRPGRRPGGRASPAEQGRDRPGVARPGPLGGAAGSGRGGRRRLRRLGAVPRRPGAAGPALRRRRHRRDGRLHRGSRGGSSPRPRPAAGRRSGLGWPTTRRGR